ncbi:unnamed protein product, partial [Durusdinium trenchii]
LQFAQLVRHRSSASMELANGCRPHPTLALAFQRMETPVSCFPLFTFATKTANAAHAAHRRWRKMSKGTSLNWPANFPELPNGRQRLPSRPLDADDVPHVPPTRPPASRPQGLPDGGEPFGESGERRGPRALCRWQNHAFLAAFSTGK